MFVAFKLILNHSKPSAGMLPEVFGNMLKYCRYSVAQLRIIIQTLDMHVHSHTQSSLTNDLYDM